MPVAVALGILLALGWFGVNDEQRGSATTEPISTRSSGSGNTRFAVLSSNRDSTNIGLRLGELQVIGQRGAGEVQHNLRLTGAGTLGRAGAPALPILRRLLAVPPCRSIELDLKVHASYVLEGVNVAPDSRGSLDESIYSANADFPESPVQIESIGYVRAQRVATIPICPFRFNPQTKQLVVLEDVEIVARSVDPSGEVAANAGPMESVLSAAVANYEALGAMPVQRLQQGPLLASGLGQVCWCETADNDWQTAAGYVIANCAADYLIVASSEADSALVDSLAQRRADYNDFNVAIVKMDQIATSPDTSATPVAIRSLIDSVYASGTAAHMGDGKLAYVLLVGDALNPAGDSAIMRDHIAEAVRYRIRELPV